MSAALQYTAKEETPILSLHIRNFNTDQMYGKLFEGMEIHKIVIEDSPMRKIQPDILYEVKDSLKVRPYT